MKREVRRSSEILLNEALIIKDDLLKLQETNKKDVREIQRDLQDTQRVMGAMCVIQFMLSIYIWVG
jgi:hypothetical protein